MENTKQQNLKRTSPWLILARILFTAGVAATLVFIFKNSAEVAEISGARSEQVLETVQTVLKEIHQQSLAERLTDHIIRKMAHFSEYMLLGFWLMLCTRVYTRRFFRHVSWPILFGLLTALCDETSQMLSSGRSPQLTDVWIDFFGVMSGLLAAFFLLCVIRMCRILYQHRNEA